MTILRGLLVDLEPLGEAYTEKMYAYWNNFTKSWATMGDDGPVSMATIKRVVEHRNEGAERGYTGVHFMMRARDGEIIGSVGLNWVDYWNRHASIGAWIGEEDYLSGGHGTEAVILLCDYAFRWLDMRRLVLMTMDINERARGASERTGFTLEQRMRKSTLFQGEWVDVVVYGMNRDEWKGRDVLAQEFNLEARARKRYGDF